MPNIKLDIWRKVEDIMQPLRRDQKKTIMDEERKKERGREEFRIASQNEKKIIK